MWMTDEAAGAGRPWPDIAAAYDVAAATYADSFADELAAKAADRRLLGDFGHPVELRVTLVHPRELSRMARDAGLPDIGWQQRPPFPAEYPTQRAYLWSGPRPTCAAGCRAAG
jgi:hypothetical protein